MKKLTDNDILYFSIGQGDMYERMLENLFRSIKKYNPNARTFAISDHVIKSADQTILIKDICPRTGKISELNICNFSCSFKVGAIKHLPEDFKTYVFFDADSECVSKIDIDSEVLKLRFYSQWEQPIVTRDKDRAKRIDLNWNWLGMSFREHQEFAKINGIKEWRNINGGFLIFNKEYSSKIFDRFKYWAKKINVDYVRLVNKNGFNQYIPNEELPFSLIMAEEDPEYKTPDAYTNNVGQLCYFGNIEELTSVRVKKEFHINPWFNSSGNPLIKVKTTVLHGPNLKKFFAA